MIRSAITVCLIPESRSGPLIFHDGLDNLLRHVNPTMRRTNNSET